MNQPPNNPYGAGSPPGGFGSPPGGYGQPPGGYGQPPGFGAPPGYPPAGPPPGMPPAGGPPPGNAAAKVSIPAILIMVFSGLAILVNIASLLMNLLNTGMGAMSGSEEGIGQALGGTLGMVGNGISIIINAVVIFGAMKMKKLESYPFALVSAILFALPCSICCVVNLPIGIWAIVVLMDANVKAAFRA